MLTVAALAVGCGRTPEIKSYDVDKPQVVRQAHPVVRAPSAAQDQTTQPARTLAAIVPRTDRAWFFKVTGNPDQVESIQIGFRQLVQSLRFSASGAPPEWTLPEGWSARGEGGMRFATLITPTTDRLEVSVMALPLTDGDWNEYVLDNVNRWRGQLQLAPVSAAALRDQLELIDVQGVQVTFVDLTGHAAVAAADPHRSLPAAGPATPSTAPAGLTYDVPSHWKPGRLGPMREAAFEVQRDGQQVEVTISIAGGDLLSNVNRWRSQISLGPIGEDQLPQYLSKLDVGGREYDYVQLIDADAPAEALSQSQAILVVILPQVDRTWFVKLMGNAQLARHEQPHFERFVQSLRLK